MNKDHILITGASSSMGEAIVKQVATEATVILAHFHQGLERIQRLKAEVPGQLIPIRADLSTEAGILSLAESVERHCDAPRKIVFLAAPRITLARMKDLGWDDFRRHHEMQVRTAVMLLGRYLPRMAKAGNGRVVFMLSSVTLGVPPSNMAHYVTAKYALLGLMKAAAAEYASKGITVNAVAPSMVETGFLGELPEKVVQLAAEQHPLKRNATPNDIAPVVKLLLSDESVYTTGVSIPVTGGVQL